MKDFLLRTYQNAGKKDRSDLEEAALAILGASLKRYGDSDRQAALKLYSEDIEGYALRSN